MKDTHTDTHCPYCALQCGMILSSGATQLMAAGNPSFPVNKGGLCIKGATAPATVDHPERLLTPLVRNQRGVLAPAGWDEALKRIARAFRDAQAKHGKDSAGLFGGGSLTNEKAYLLGKFARVALATSNIDYNGRFCMSSAAAAAIRAFGIDRGLPFPLEDIPEAEVIVLAGCNVAETMPPIMQYFNAQRANGGKLIVIDPRFTVTAQSATLHLRLTPGSDAALANGLLHLLVREGSIDTGYIRERTEGFEDVRNLVATYWPERVERITGVPESQIIEASRLLAGARTVMVLTARGAEQQSHGVENTLAYINIALALGMPGKPFSGYGCVTGQGNGQGGREHGQKADQLPGYRKIDDISARRHLAGIWGVLERDIPGPGKSAYEMLDSLGQPDGVRALMVVGSNPVVSAPNSLHIEQRVGSLDFLAVADFFLSETAQIADAVLPTAQWAEEEGTMTNLEGRVILRKRAISPPPGVRTDIQVICALAALLDKGNSFSYSSTQEVFDELRRASQGGAADYSGISYEKIALENGVFWPCPAEGHPGTPRMFSSGFATPSGRARFHPIPHQPPAEEPNADYPLYLTTGRVMAQYQSGTQTRRVPELQQIASEPFAEINTATAKRYGLADSDSITLVSRRGTAKFKVKITNSIAASTVFVPFHWGGILSANRLTNPALDPISKMPEFKVCAVRIEPKSGVDPATVDD
ncbi:MAG TPA: molybdopterin oxidoreductase family protein [Blastocatellia bacterium]|nr:molybdopterin oxidoreductase family protein [Blastocatellia bacterium]